MPSASFSDRREAIAPTIVTSSPSRIQTVPSPTMTSQCQLLQGSRSMRAGILVLTVSSATGPYLSGWATRETVPGHPLHVRVRTVVALVLLLAGCGGSASKAPRPAATTQAVAEATAAPTPVPKLTGGKACKDIAGATCSTLTVPLDRTTRTKGDLNLQVVSAGDE